LGMVMIKKRFLLSLPVFLLLSLMLLPPISPGIEKAPEKTSDISIDTWLLLGPFPSPFPALFNGNERDNAIKGLVQFKQIDTSKFHPRQGDSIRWYDGTQSTWREIRAGENGILLQGDDTHPTITYLAVYLEVKRWTRAKISIQSPYPFRLCIDRDTCSSKLKTAAEGGNTLNGKKNTIEMGLERGKHLLVVKSVYVPGKGIPWTIKGTLSIKERYAFPPPSFSLSPQKFMTLHHLLETPQVTDVSLSPDGSLAAVTVQKPNASNDEKESWVELYDVKKGKVFRTYRGGTAVSSVNWAPTGKRFSYVTREKSGSSLWVEDLEEGTTLRILQNTKDLGSHMWSPTGDCILYTITEKGDKDQSGVKRFRNLADRQPWWRNRTYLYKVTLEGGVKQRLTAGESTTTFHSMSPDGKKILYSRTLIDYTERPFAETELYSLDISTADNELLWKGKWFNDAKWSPDGKKILILGGPSTFGNKGINIPQDMIPNEFDVQAYLFDPTTREPEAISRDFQPSIEQAEWSLTDEAIYFVTTDHAFKRLYRYDLDRRRFTYVHCQVDSIEHFDLARNAPLAIIAGSSANIPSKAYIIALKNTQVRLLADPAADEFADVSFGKVERWTFKNKDGVLIDGHVYYPPDFNEDDTYPCIVYYYGGTTPVTRQFGGRYPKNLWAAQGYIVYVLQPSGAVGYGQQFSALHVNDWGSMVTEEIIQGVKAFLAAHPFVNPNKVGCIGASYGGFITLLLQTRTNIFSAAVSHAGISSISSYWGEGYYGYWYLAYAAANSYPWNRKDIFINQSVIFNADKITTPLLLLHGAKDTNVPPGESTQLFTALKILGREVEYIQILDQDHQILTPSKRKIWTQTILAWFDRWLKDQPEWWYSLYPGN